MKKNKTFYDIAEHAGVSIATVSRYFNKPDKLSKKTIKNIEESISELDYRQNPFAKVLASGKSEIIGLIVPNLTLDYYSALLNEILEYSKSKNLKCMVFSSNANYEDEINYIKELDTFQVKGIINYSPIIPPNKLEELGFNFVVIEREFGNLNSVCSDNFTGGIQAYNHLCDIGCTVFIHINTRYNGSPTLDRARSFVAECKKDNKTYEFIEKDFSNNMNSIQDYSDEVIDYILEKYPNDKVGFFIASDYYAVIFLNQLIKRNISVPNRFAVIGFDNSPISYQNTVQLTTISQDIKKIATSSVDLLLETCENEELNKHIVVDVELLIRDSTSN